LGVFVATQTKETSVVIGDVVLENVEALASAEIPGPTTCRGDGEVVCPSHDRKCAVVYIGYSLR
jgi:hypothetical protein